MPCVKISSRNQIVLPKEVREELRLKGGDELLLVVKGGTASLLPKTKSWAEALSGKGKGLYPKGYLKRERRSW